jgi:hypothetical protein
MYVVLYHNEHAMYTTACDAAIIGPYPDMVAAKARLRKIVVDEGDELFKLNPNPDGDNDDTYAGYNDEELIAAGRDEDLASEIWAEIVELLPPT